MTDWVTLFIEIFASSAIGFVLGLLFRKRNARWLVTAKKRLFNDVMVLDILSIRSYEPTNLKDFNRKDYGDIGKKLPHSELLDVFPNVIRVKVPVFGILKISAEKIPCEEAPKENEETLIDSIKLALIPENSVRLGTREIHLLDDYGKYVELLFGTIEKSLETVKIKQNYTLIEIPRVGHFKEEKTFDYEDEVLGASIHATPTKITVTIDSSIQIAKAVTKYLLV
jgi:hypothetical protein